MYVRHVPLFHLSLKAIISALWTPFHPSNPLWDGVGCGRWQQHMLYPQQFPLVLTQPTTDNMVMRLCRDQEQSNDLIEAVEIYVQ